MSCVSMCARCVDNYHTRGLLLQSLPFNVIVVPYIRDTCGGTNNTNYKRHQRLGLVRRKVYFRPQPKEGREEDGAGKTRAGRGNTIVIMSGEQAEG